MNPLLIPQRIKDTDEFDKLRLIRNHVIDSKNIVKNKISNKIKEIRRPKRILSDEEKEYLAGVIEDVDLSSVPVFGEDAPLVSIVVVNRDGLGHLERLFGAMGAVSDFYPNFEVVVVDNASSDGSVDFVRGWDGFRVVVVENDVNESFSRANNQALDVASGDYLLFLNNDVEPLSGFLNFMMESLLGGDGVGAVGARLFYPDCSGSRLNREKSFSVQHDGIVFRESEGFVRPFNRGNGCEVVDCDEGVVRRVAGVTGACLLVERGVFERFGGFDEAFVYGYEDVDFCLKLVRAGLDVLCDGRARLYHYEFGTQELDVGREVRDRRLSNRRVFVGRWNSWLRRELLLDKLSGGCVFGDGALTVAFVVTECGEGAVAGDYFTALGLAGVFESFGWDVRFLSQDSGRWYFVDDDVDVLVSLLDRYDLSRVVCGNGLLVKVAWLRNWFERWVGRPYFMMYDLVLCSSSLACDFVSDATGKESILFPIATDTDMFNEEVKSSDEFSCDYCFTGSYWDAKREIIQCLNPAILDYSFNLYGANWDKIDKLSDFNYGFVGYDDLPRLYASTKIVLDDANHVTRKYGSVNSRVFDALAMGKLVLTNGSLGNNEIFDGEIPEYHSQKQLNSLLGFYLENPIVYEKKVKQLQKIVLEKHTYKHRAETFKQTLEDYINKKKIAIKIPAPSWEESHKWGDFYMALGLMKEFNKKDYFVKLQVLPEWDTNGDANMDMVLVLRGLSEYTPKLEHYNIMWNISHPDVVELQEYELYDHVFIASQKWADTVSSRVNVPVECMWQCTDTDRFYPDYSPEYHHELLFVGNSRKVHRKILKDLLPTEHELAVYGSDWKRHINKKYIIAEHIDNKELRKAYSSCDILLNDHWDDMREKGFVSNRIFDAIACGTCIISDDIDGLEELFNDRVITYHNKNELKGLVDENLENKKSYDIEIIEGHTYSDRVEQFIEVLK